MYALWHIMAVLILILLEYGLQLRKYIMEHLAATVLILILLEYGLQHTLGKRSSERNLS